MPPCCAPSSLQRGTSSPLFHVRIQWVGLGVTVLEFWSGKWRFVGYSVLELNSFLCVGHFHKRCSFLSRVFFFRIRYSYIGLMSTRGEGVYKPANAKVRLQASGSTPNAVALTCAWCKVFIASLSLNTMPYEILNEAPFSIG